jgi:predicted DsbA family dithiol-disulfide isomerase/SAM-dependent methyltransferase
LASMRTHTTPVKSAGLSMGVRSDGPAMTQASSLQHLPSSSGGAEHNSVRMHSTQMTPSSSPESLVSPFSTIEDDSVQVQAKENDVGDYWLPWHIDSNFLTIIHKEMYAYESDASFAPEPEGAGVIFMNGLGETTTLDCEDDGIMILQMGAFAQIYAGGHVTACRHAVLSTAPKGIARFNFCNFWYIPWDTVCHPPPGTEDKAVNKGWNAMMDESYVDITMKQSFAAFRQFMTSPEARLQFADSVRFKELSELLPLPTKAIAPSTSGRIAEQTSEIVVDVMTDLRCPISYISLLNLNQALKNLGMLESTTIRYHPVFLNPNVPKEGESLDDYLFREFGYSKEYARSETYPLRLLGLEAGVNFNPDRRVVNTFSAACLVEMAQESGKQREMVELISRSYFEDAKDISDENILCQLAATVGLDEVEVRRRLQEADGSLQNKVTEAFQEFSSRVDEVPHFVFRESISGNGVEVGGRKSTDDWERVIGATQEKGRFVGMSVPGPDSTEVRLLEARPFSPVSMAFDAQHGWAQEGWPFAEEDFGRMDESPDAVMYSQPRFVNHLDEASLARLTNAYRSIFATGPPGFALLDMCSSWVSHFPADMPKDARIVALGLNEAEVRANMQATEWCTQNLNENTKLPFESNSFDFVTNALSVQYLTQPQAVFSEMHRVLRPGGMAIVAFSHRCFIEKAVNVWARETYDGEGHAHLIRKYFQHGPVGGWTKMSSADVSPSHGDPMWLVTAIKARVSRRSENWRFVSSKFIVKLVFVFLLL